MHKIRAFLVEDNPVIREALIPAMEELADVEVVAVADREDQALEWLDGHYPEISCLILDMFLIQGNGLGVLVGLRERSIDIPVIVLSNHATDAMRERCLKAGARAFFDKARENDDFFDYLAAFRSRIIDA